MEIKSALALVDTLVYKPGWTFEGHDHTNRFEGAIKVKITYPALNSNRENAETGYPEAITTYAEFPMIVADCDDLQLYRQLIDKLIEIETHEIREFFRVLPTYWAPFHPHRIGGMRAWGENTIGDLQFGIA